MLQSGGTVDDLLIELKRAGLSQVDCIRAVIQLGVSEPHDAKKLVHFSRAWSATRVQSEQFHDELIREISPELDEPS